MAQDPENLQVREVEIALADCLESGALTPGAYRTGVNAFDAALLATQPGSVRRNTVISNWLLKLEELSFVQQVIVDVLEVSRV